jgi:hypothetical protein
VQLASSLLLILGIAELAVYATAGPTPGTPLANDWPFFFPLIEIAGAAGLLVTRTRRHAGVVLMLALGTQAYGREGVLETVAPPKSPAWFLEMAPDWRELHTMPRLEYPSGSSGPLRVHLAGTTAARQPWDIRVDRRGLMLKRHARQVVRFRIRADAQRQLAYRVQASGIENGDVLYRDTSAGPEWQERAAILGPTADGEAIVSFNLGESAISVEIDDVRIEHLPLAAVDELTDATLDFHGAAASGTSPPVIELPRGFPLRMRVAAPPGVDNLKAADVQLNYRGAGLAKGQRYTLSFDARADAPRTFGFGVARARAPYDSLGLFESGQLTPEWHTFATAFTAVDSEALARVAFDLGEDDAAMEVARVVLRPEGASPASSPPMGTGTPTAAARDVRALVLPLQRAIEITLFGMLALIVVRVPEPRSAVHLAAWMLGAVVGCGVGVRVVEDWGFGFVLIAGSISAWVGGSIVLAGARQILDRPASSADAPAARWHVNIAYWMLLVVAATGLHLWLNARGSDLTFAEGAYIGLNRTLTYALLIGIVHVADRFGRTQWVRPAGFLYLFIAAAMPLIIAVDFLVAEKTGVLLIDGAELVEQNGGAGIEGFVEWSGSSSAALLKTFVAGVVLSILLVRVMASPSRRLDSRLSLRVWTSALVVVAMAMVPLELMGPYVLDAASQRMFDQHTRLRLLEPSGAGQTIPIVARFKGVPADPDLAAQRPQALSRKPDIYVIVVDSLRSDAITKTNAPRLHAFMQDAWSAGRTFSASYSSELSWFGLFRSRHSIRWNEQDDRQGAYPLRLLKALGYRLEVRMSSDARWQGLGERIYGPRNHLADVFVDDNHELLEMKAAPEGDEILHHDLIRSIRSRPAGGTFYIQEYMGPHWPYGWPSDYQVPYADFAPPAIFVGTRLNYDQQEVERIRRRYLNSVHWADALIGRLEDELRRSGRYDDSMIIITGDHGEDLYEHRRWAHGSALCRHQTEVPILIKWPKFTIPPAAREVMGHVDVMPTVMTVLGVDRQLTASLEGISALSPRNAVAITSASTFSQVANLVLAGRNGRLDVAYVRRRADGGAIRLRFFEEAAWPDRPAGREANAHGRAVASLLEDYREAVDTLLTLPTQAGNRPGH